MFSKKYLTQLISFKSNLYTFLSFISDQHDLLFLDKIIEYLSNQFDKQEFQIGDEVEIIEFPNDWVNSWKPHMIDMISLNFSKGSRFIVNNIVLSDELFVDLKCDSSFYRNVDGNFEKTNCPVIYGNFPCKYLKLTKKFEYKYDIDQNG